MPLAFADVLGCAIGAFLVIGLAATAGGFAWDGHKPAQPRRPIRNGGMKGRRR